MLKKILSEESQALLPRSKRADTESVLKTDWHLGCCVQSTGKDYLADWGPEKEMREELHVRSRRGEDVWLTSPDGKKLLPWELWPREFEFKPTLPPQELRWVDVLEGNPVIPEGTIRRHLVTCLGPDGQRFVQEGWFANQFWLEHSEEASVPEDEPLDERGGKKWNGWMWRSSRESMDDIFGNIFETVVAYMEMPAIYEVKDPLPPAYEIFNHLEGEVGFVYVPEGLDPLAMYAAQCGLQSQFLRDLGYTFREWVRPTPKPKQRFKTPDPKPYHS